MKKNVSKKIWLIITSFYIFCTILIPNNIKADNDLEVDWFNILPELTESEISWINKKIEDIWQTWWHVREKYNDYASGMSTSDKIASWIMDWDTIMDYIVFLINFLSQLWITVWVVFIMFAWYKYMVSVFDWWKAWNSSSIVKNAIIWVVIVIFSYAIMRILTSVIWLT